MIVVGITGGIGSGKTTIAGFFKELGIPVYIADDEAKLLMNTSKELQREIINLFGEEAYREGLLNRPYIASKVFNSKKMLSSLNAIVHPAVRKHFQDWVAAQNAPYVMQEAAILFENGGYNLCDFTILVTAPLKERIARTIKREGTTENEVIKRMKAQWSDDRKAAMADVVVENIKLEEAKNAVSRIHTHIMVRLDKGWA